MSEQTQEQSSQVGGEIVQIEFKNFYPNTEKVKNHHVFFVKSEYAKQHPDYAKFNSIELFKNTDIQKFLHNPNGPALLDCKNNLKTYFLDGQLIMEDTEEFKKIKHNETFNNQMDKMLTE